MSEFATYHFIPWVRRGLANLIQKDATGKRSVLDIMLSVSAGNGTVNELPPKKVELIGPGDIVGFDPGIVTRTDPKSNIGDFEPNYFPAIEFAEPDFPWRFTASPSQKTKFAPWITLIVLTADEFDYRNLPGQIPWIEVHDRKSLPKLSEAWRWAHVQLSGAGNLRPQDLQATLAQTIQTNPERVVSRLLCTRRLQPSVLYHAFVVPTFRLGLMPLKGQVKTASDVSALAFAWNDKDPNDKDPIVRLPYYYQWEFRTGQRGDFEALVRLLQGRCLEKIGVREIDCGLPGYDIPGVVRDQIILTGTDGAQMPQDEKRGTLKLEGALKSLDTCYSLWGADTVIRNVTVMVDSSGTAATIEWHTTYLSTSRLEYGAKVEYERPPIEEDTPASSHSFTLNWLTPAAEYHYRIIAKFKEGNNKNVEVATLDATFRTAASTTSAQSRDLRESLAKDLLNKPVGILGPATLVSYPTLTNDIFSKVAIQISGPDAWITWTTTEEATSYVEYDRVTQSEQRIQYRQTKDQFDLEHRIMLRQLTPDTSYTFQIVSKTRDDTSHVTVKSEFVTPPLPCVVPPIYGRWHAARSTVDPALPPDKATNWLDELNLDPRHRAVAGMGADIIKDQQEPLMASAWQQLGAINEANKILRNAQLGRESAGHVHKRLEQLNEGSYLRLTAPVHMRTLVSINSSETATVGKVLGQTPIPMEALAPAFRRIGRKCGPLHKHQKKVPQDDLLQRFDFEPAARLVVAGKHPAPQGMQKFGGVFHDTSRRSTDELRLEIRSTRKVSIINQHVSINVPLSSVTLMEALKKKVPSINLPDAMISTVFDDWLADPDDQPDDKIVVSFKDLKTSIHDALRPNVTILERVKHLILKNNVSSRPDDELGTILAAPEFTQPMYKPLSDKSQEFFIPGIETIPQNTIGLLETNRRFVEAYLCGCNHEFAAELLWREYPTDQRGSYFQQFWDVSDYCPATDSGGSPTTEQIKDIKPLHTWSATRLGDNADRRAQDHQEKLVLIIRGDLIKKYPRPTIYAVEAKENADAKRFPGLAEYFCKVFTKGSIGIEKAVAEPWALPGKANALIKWTTQSAATSQVDWWTNDATRFETKSSGEQVTEHAINLDGLIPDTEYHVRIISKTESQHEYRIDDNTFKTPPAPIFPIFGGPLSPDILFVGFPFTAEEARGQAAKYAHGIYFILEERISEARFGMDVDPSDVQRLAQLKTWNDLSWGHLSSVHEGEYIDDKAPPRPADAQGKNWDSSSASVAWITLQKPVRVAIHAIEMMQNA
jgi:hypothetical protein